MLKNTFLFSLLSSFYFSDFYIDFWLPVDFCCCIFHLLLGFPVAYNVHSRYVPAWDGSCRGLGFPIFFPLVSLPLYTRVPANLEWELALWSTSCTDFLLSPIKPFRPLTKDIFYYKAMVFIAFYFLFVYDTHFYIHAGETSFITYFKFGPTQCSFLPRVKWRGLKNHHYCFFFPGER